MRRDRARRPRLRGAAPAAPRADCRRRRRAPSTPGSSRSTTWSSPTAAARSGSATPAGCRCAPTRTGAASSAGTAPTRWSGWVELPRHDVPPDGQVVTANERRGSESELLGNEFAPPHRASRIHALLRGRDDLTVADFEIILGDSFAIMALPLCAMVRDLVPGPAGEPVRDAILEWDGVMAAGSRGAAAFAAWRSALTTRLCAEPAFAAMRDASVYGALFAPYLSLEASVGWAPRVARQRGDTVRHRRTPSRDRGSGGRRRAPGLVGRDPRARTDPRVRRRRRGPRATRRADHAGVRRHRHDPRHRLAAGAHRRGLPRLGRPLRVGPRRPRTQRLGGADGCLGRPPVARTTSTSSRPGPRPGSCRSSWTGTGSSRTANRPGD